MGIIEQNRMCCMHCIYWYGCLVIAKNDTGFSCSSCYCKFFERNDKPAFKDKLAKNKWGYTKYYSYKLGVKR